MFARFPELEASLPRLALGEGPSPVTSLRELGRRIGGELWIKNDGLYGTVYGGNKPRKLEFILADALRKGARTLITFGALGTNHGLATALYGRQLGLRVILLLTYQEPLDEVGRKLCWMQAAGAHLHYTRSLPQTVLLTPLFMLRHAQRRPLRWPYLLWPGGSTPLGCLGYVNAALELAEQVRESLLPEPRAIVVPLASAGTAAGLALGLRICGLNSRLLAVPVTRAPTASAPAVARLANAAARLLRRRGAALRAGPVRASDIDIVRGWQGRGYGRPTAEGEEAKALLAETEGLALESTYTAKAAAALLALVRSGRLAQGPVLYWHTYNAIPPPLPEPSREDYRRLPAALRNLLQKR